MNFLSIFVLIPLLMLLGLWLSRNIAQIRTVMVVGSSALLIAAVALTVGYLQARAGGDTAEMLFRADTVWYAPLHIAYSVGVDGISVAMLLLSAVIVFTGTFASWRLQPLVVNGSIRVLYLDRPFHHVHVLRNRTDPDVSVNRCMGFGS